MSTIGIEIMVKYVYYIFGMLDSAQAHHCVKEETQAQKLHNT